MVTVEEWRTVSKKMPYLAKDKEMKGRRKAIVTLTLAGRKSKEIANLFGINRKVINFDLFKIMQAFKDHPEIVKKLKERSQLTKTDFKVIQRMDRVLELMLRG